MYHASFAVSDANSMCLVILSDLGRAARRSMSALALAACLTACSQTAQQSRDPAAAAPVDFSGHWELNFAQSDNVQAQMNTLVRNLRKQAEREAARRGERGRPGIVLGGSGTDSAPSIVGLARMAELITDSQLFDVEQSRTQIQVKREGNFALTCDFLRQATSVRDLGVGGRPVAGMAHSSCSVSRCPRGCRYDTVSASRHPGNSSVSIPPFFSDRVSSPFSVQRVYNRFEPGTRGYRCEMTLTRGRVCTTESP